MAGELELFKSLDDRTRQAVAHLAAELRDAAAWSVDVEGEIGSALQADGSARGYLTGVYHYRFRVVRKPEQLKGRKDGT